tara:strand:- start:226 stop:618 length:393 start_codon:yes stop_codon:yes gene_type:complete
MGGKRKKTKVISLAQAFEKDGTAITWKNLGDKAKIIYDTPADALDVLTKYSQNLRKAAQGTQPIVDFINAKLRKKKQPINKIINDNLKELCPLINVKYTSVSPTTKPAKGKQGRQEIINRIFMRYSRAKK